MKGGILLIVLSLPCTPAIANEESRLFEIGGDVFMAGSQPAHNAIGTDDLFMAGETLRSSTDVAGSAHMAGRRVKLQGQVGQDIYAFGMELLVSNSVGGDATLAGYEVSLEGKVGGALRVAGSKINVAGPVSGYALIAGENVTLNTALAGDVSLAAETVEFGSDARIDGQLFLYEENPGELKVPEYVIAQSRIQRRHMDDMRSHGDRDSSELFSWRRAILGILSGVIFITALTALLAGLAPQHLASMRRKILGAPFRTLGLGFLAQSTVIGSAIVFALTVIGLFITPAAILLAFLTGFAGYVVGSYAFGVAILARTGKTAEPVSFNDRALAAGVGALAVALIGLIPFLGWLFVLAVVLVGVGALTALLFRPAFFI